MQQIVYQVINRLRSKPCLAVDAVLPTTCWLAFAPPDKPQSLIGRTFTFLNQSVKFPGEIDWNYEQNGKLWQYNLNYFDFLNQSSLEADQGVGLILDFVSQTAGLKGGLEPYPASLRIINWIRFLSHHRLRLTAVDAHLLAQIRLLEHRLEYHLLGNHLLENGFALLIGALYFQDRNLYQKAIHLVCSELTEQFCQDGGHYERSPMYHQILLDRLLDCCYILQNNSWHQDHAAGVFLLDRACRMLSWLESMTFTNGEIPLMNDAADGIAPTTAQLRSKAESIGIEPKQIALSESGFCRFQTSHYEAVANVGSVGPDHQPGHAHADTFTFLLHVHGQPVIVDTGTSTYEANARRQWERSTAAHNTVQVAGADSSEVWGGFRVGRRANVTLLEDSPKLLRAQHDGFRHLGVSLYRSWIPTSNQLTIIDTVSGEQTATARFYLAPGMKPLAVEPNRICFSWGKMEWHHAILISQKAVQVAQQFNRLLPTLVIEVEFRQTLRTIITCVG